VSRYLLDTNILSDPTKQMPSQLLAEWLVDQAEEDLFIASLSVAEIWRGVEEKPTGRRRTELERWFAGPNGPQSVFAGHILPFDEEAALVWGSLMAEGTRTGRPRSPIDMMVAAVADANGCVLVSGNEKHFWGLKFINPMRAKN
jgi:predicted nucleic acid-binding protein